MAGYHLLAAPLAPTRAMLHSRNIDWGCDHQPGAGGKRHSDTTVPEGQRPTQGVHQRPVSAPKEKRGLGMGGGGLWLGDMGEAIELWRGAIYNRQSFVW